MSGFGPSATCGDVRPRAAVDAKADLIKGTPVIAVTDLDARADRVHAIAEGNFGRVIGREGDIIHIEVPAYISIGLNVIWGMSGFMARSPASR